MCFCVYSVCEKVSFGVQDVRVRESDWRADVSIFLDSLSLQNSTQCPKKRHYLKQYAAEEDSRIMEW